MKVRQILPCGILHTEGGNVYWLLSPGPVSGDWELDHHGIVRFAAIPIHVWADTSEGRVWKPARHVVTNSFTIDYRPDLEPIMVQTLEHHEKYVEEIITIGGELEFNDIQFRAHTRTGELLKQARGIQNEKLGLELPN